MKRALIILLITVLFGAIFLLTLNLVGLSQTYSRSILQRSTTMHALDAYIAKAKNNAGIYQQKYNAIRNLTGETYDAQRNYFTMKLNSWNYEANTASRYRTNWIQLLLAYDYYLKRYGSRYSRTRYYKARIDRNREIILRFIGAKPIFHKTLGVVVAGNPYADLPALEQKTGHKFKSFLWYQSVIEDFNWTLADWLYSRGATLQLSWEPRNPSGDSVNQPAYRLAALTRGDHDADIRKWARQLRDFGKLVYFRPMCEMNSNWTSWSGNANGNKPSDYIPAWRHIFNIFQQEGATNVKFIWTPNRDGSTTDATATLSTYYPGSAYVHYIGINGYNWGRLYNTPTWTSEWQYFGTVFGPSYKAFTSATSKEIIITETASTEIGGDKAAWTRDTLLKLRYSYRRVKSLYWFNLDKETDWRIQSSTSNLDTFKAYAKFHY